MLFSVSFPNNCLLFLDRLIKLIEIKAQFTGELELELDSNLEYFHGSPGTGYGMKELHCETLGSPQSRSSACRSPKNRGVRRCFDVFSPKT